MQTTLMTYQTRINAALTLEQLVDALHEMDPSLVAEALEVVKEMDEGGFRYWRKGWEQLSQENETEPIHQEWFDRYIDLIVPPPIARMELFLTEEL